MSLLFTQTQILQKCVAEEYAQIESQFIEQEKHLDRLKNMKCTKEKNLIKNNILF
jgi:hypothetical protein